MLCTLLTPCLIIWIKGWALGTLVRSFLQWVLHNAMRNILVHLDLWHMLYVVDLHAHSYRKLHSILILHISNRQRVWRWPTTQWTFRSTSTIQGTYKAAVGGHNLFQDPDSRLPDQTGIVRGHDPKKSPKHKKTMWWWTKVNHRNKEPTHVGMPM